MSDDKLEHGLAAIADHGHRTGRLEAAGALRARGDRRRRRRYAATGAFGVLLAGVLGVGIAVARPPAQTPSPSVAAASDPAPPTALPSVPLSSAPLTSPSAVKTPSRPPASPSRPASGGGGVLSGDRQVFLYVLDDGAEVPDSVPAVTSSGRLDITADYGDRALLVPVPKSPGSKQFLVKTGKLRSGGEALCLQVRSNGSDPLTLVTKACDAGRKDQSFRFQENGRDNQDRMTYLISVDGLYMRYDPDGPPGTGLIVQESGEGDDLTSFVIIDRGQATIPSLD
jgi:hypothetical protein